MHDFSVGEGCGELFKRGANCGYAFENLSCWKNRDVILREVDSSLEGCDQCDQILFDRLQAAGESAFELLCRNLGLIESLRVDEIADGFGLGEVDASVEEGAHGELARFGKARAAGHCQFDYVMQDCGRSVGGDFYDVVGCVGVGFGEVSDNHFVDATCRALLGWTTGGGCPRKSIGWVDQFSEQGASGLEIML